jgi:DNA-binding NtrC family response regulator
VNHTERHDISWEEVSENMVRMRIEEEVTEASDNATRLKLGVLKALVRTLITELDILENYTVPDKKGMNREGVDFYEEVKRFEVQLIHDALETAAGQQQRAAELLKLNPTTLNSKIKRYGIPWEASKIAAEADLLTSRCEGNTSSALLAPSDLGSTEQTAHTGSEGL